MSFTITLMDNLSPVEKIGKDLQSGVDITGCSLKDSTSVIRPVVKVKSSNAGIPTYNYMYIQEFSRYYFIDDIISLNNDIWEISAHVDVLETYKSAILNQQAVISRQQNKFNLYLNDPDFHTLNYDMIQTKQFSNTAGFNKTLNYILVVNGS